MKNIILAALLVWLPTQAFALPNDYQSRTAQEKLTILNSLIQKSAYSGVSNYPTKGPGILDSLKLFGSKFLTVTFLNESDEFPLDRKRLIHTYGSCAPVEFVIERNSPFTGLFATGGIGIARLSLATPTGFTPGMGLKMLIDGQPSKNFQVMNSVDGQDGDRNFFSKNFSNWIPSPQSRVLKTLGKAFDRAIALLDRPPVSSTQLPLEEAAAVDRNGNSISNWNAPEQIIFRPSADVSSVMGSNDEQDFRISLRSIPTGATLYDIYLRAAGSTTSSLVGSLVLKGPLLASSYCDQSLFFQHQSRMPQ